MALSGLLLSGDYSASWEWEFPDRFGGFGSFFGKIMRIIESIPTGNLVEKTLVSAPPILTKVVVLSFDIVTSILVEKIHTRR